MLREPDPHFRLLDRALAGRYVLERRLGRGGMGVVFLARELRLERRVAIKLLLPAKAVDPVARERFLVEARTAAQLTHPNIVPIFAVDELSDVVFFAMAYIEGQTLGQRVRERGPLPPKEAARLLRDVGWALAHAHERGVVHRDVKPDNILLDAATGRALVSDFGIARVGAGGGITGPREVVGTAEFMSPEQASGLGVDARSDLYSLGVVGYYALSGQLPFAAGDSYEMMARHIAVPPRPLASVAPGVPRRLARIIDRCLLKEPAARFTSGAHLADAVRLAGLLRRLAYAGVCIAATAVATGLRAPGLASSSVPLAACGIAAGVALLAAVMARARTEHRTDPKRERRLRFWGGPLGGWLFRFAGLGLARAPAPTAAQADRPSPDMVVGAVAEEDGKGR